MYKLFDKYILRTPIFPVNYFFKLTQNDIISDEQLINEFNNPIISEAIYLASPVLHKEIEKWTNSETKNDKEKAKIINSFLKYLSRLSSRSTPFGLFGGSTIGNIANQDVIIKESQKNRRHTRLDMNLTGLLIKHIEKDIFIKNQLLFYPNTSLYIMGNQLRYVESNYKNNDVLVHQIVEVENSLYLDKILNYSKDGLKINDIANIIIDSEITLEEALEFIYELIDNQILISELGQTVSGAENLDKILSVLDTINYIDELKNKIKLIKEKLTQLDLKIGNTINLYVEIITVLESLEIKFNEKFIFQTDLYSNTKHNSLNSDVNVTLYESLLLLNKISSPNENNNLKEFKKSFFERYENREMPLSLVLDEENGIGYPIKSYKSDLNPLIDDLFFKVQPTTETKNIEWSKMHTILLKKLVDSIQDKARFIELNANDYNDFPINWDNLCDTFSTISQIISINGNKKILIEAFIGSSAGNLLGRFCHGNSEINSFISEIVDFETNISSDKIVAEIIHLPENRIGNILMRPSFRKYEIPYLSKSSKPIENQILLNDILISVRNNKIVLKSKSKNKEILPRLTTAHSYSNSSLPVYHFLCDMQFNDKRCFLNFDWGSLKDEFSFFPRVVYKAAILSTAKWKISTEKIKEIMKISNKKALIEKIKEWCTAEDIPQYVYLVEGDNKLLINLFNLQTLDMFFSEIKNKNIIILEEFLFENEFICNDDKKEGYVNEFIFSFYNNTTNKTHNN
jgi:hypothetical protein